MATNLVDGLILDQDLNFVAIGGTGSRALIPLLHLCALGLGPKKLRVLIIDADENNAAVENAKTLLDAYQKTRKRLAPGEDHHGMFRTEVVDAIPNIRAWSPIQQQDFDPGKEFASLVGAREAAGTDLGTLFDLLFSKKDQEMHLDKGFRCVPAIGTIFMHRLREEKFFDDFVKKNISREDSKFFVVGSLFGGTGASGLPVVGELLGKEFDQSRIGACLVLPYFSLPTAEVPVDDGGRRPNDSTFAEAVKAALPHYMRNATGYGAHYVLGDDDRRTQPRNAVGGGEQDNIPDYIEIMAALAALDFVTRGTGGPKFRYTAVNHRRISWDDLPVTEETKSQFARGILSVHTVLTAFRPDGEQHTDMRRALTGATWLRLLGWTAKTLEHKDVSGFLNELGNYCANFWGWFTSCAGLDLTHAKNTATETEFDRLLAGWEPAKHLPTVMGEGNEVFRFWNLAAGQVRRRELSHAFLELLEKASHRMLDTWYRERANPTPDGRRNLLPPFGPAGGPGLATVGDWSDLGAPSSLGEIQIRLGDLAANGADINAAGEDITSIPSPWARFVLMRDAIEDKGHPAHFYAKMQVLDAVEFLWQHGQRRQKYEWIQLDLTSLAVDTGIPTRNNLAAALLQFLPNELKVDGQPTKLTVVMGAHHKPILGASPYTIMITAPDAANASELLFFGGGPSYKGLWDRNRSFQRYVAEVLHAQLHVAASPPADPHYHMDTVFVLGRLTSWLKDETTRCNGIQAQFDNWQAAASALKLEHCARQMLGITVFSRGAEIDSRWRLAPGRAGAESPIVIDRESFDGRLYDGARHIDLPTDDQLRLASQERLPVLEDEMKWVCPTFHWLPDQVLFLNNPITPGAVYAPRVKPADTAVHFVLPLTGDFFRYFTPPDIPKIATLTVVTDGDESDQFAGVERLDLILSVPLASGQHVPVRRTYEKGDFKLLGPDISIWPSVIADDWKDYLIFRRDVTEGYASDIRMIPLRAGVALPVTSKNRTPEMSLIHTDDAVEVIEFRSDMGVGNPELLGVLIPRYQEMVPLPQEWVVGVDFGTSNTVVAVSDAEREEVFESIEIPVMHLTDTAGQFAHLLNSFFFSAGIPGAPFGTAIVCSSGYHSVHERERPVGTQLAVPIDRHLAAPGNNDIWGDLKWSASRGAILRTEGFLAHLMAAVCSAAVAKGISPKNLTFRWSYPRAFTNSQRQTLAAAWTNLGRKYECKVPADGVPESQAALAFFTKEEMAGVHAQGATILLDVGGGTTDVAAYGGGDVILYDSVLLGGRNLVGPLGDDPNPFVEALVRWAKTDGHLDPFDADTVNEYRDAKQEHLALGFLLSLKWFDETGHRFALQPEHRHMEGIVLYFWSALFYYLGMWARNDPILNPPHSVILCGNGSRFLDWLTAFSSGGVETKIEFFDALRGVFSSASAGKAEDRDLRIHQSPTPKLEVVRGLVTSQRTLDNRQSATYLGPLAGEQISLTRGGASWMPSDSVQEEFKEADLRDLKFAGDVRELDRFHAAFLEALNGLTEDNWPNARETFGSVMRRMGSDKVAQQAGFKLENLVRENGGFKASFFILEVSIVLERLLRTFFHSSAARSSNV